MDTIDPIRFLLAFVFVLGLIGVMAMLLKRYGMKHMNYAVSGPESARLKVLEVKYLDPKRKLVLISRDSREHLLLLADGRETVVESFDKKDG